MTTHSTGRLCLGLYGMNYYGGFSPVLNWRKTSTDTYVVGGISRNETYMWDNSLLDSDGELPSGTSVTSFNVLWFARAGVGNIANGWSMDGESWNVAWDGTATATSTGVSQSWNNAAGTGTLSFGTNPGNNWVTFTVTNSADPPRNIRIYQTRYATNWANGEKFNPDWINDIKPFGILRFMDLLATNASTVADISDFTSEAFYKWGIGGSKRGFPLQLIVDIANQTGCDIHFCIPHLATDTCVQDIATFFRDGITGPSVVNYEYSNECWNFQFTQTVYCYDQGTVIFGTAGDRYSKYYGYRSAACMKLIRDVYANRSRWRGEIGTQTANSAVTSSIITGIDYWRANVLAPPNSLTIADLFNDLMVTGYWSDSATGKKPTAITNNNPGLVTLAAHGYSNGQELKFFVATGMTGLDNTFVTVANKTTDTFELSGVDTTSMGTWNTTGNNYCVKSELWRLMDQSVSLNGSDPTTYPTIYTYVSSKVKDVFLHGSASGTSYTATYNIDALHNTYWPPHKTIADSNGLQLRQYEGGLSFVGNVYINANGGEPQFTDFLVNDCHSQNSADQYAAMYAAFFDVGGLYPAKFVEGGQISQYGSWAGMAFIPGDEDNPVWQATLNANLADNFMDDALTLRLRLGVENTGNAATGAVPWALYVDKNGSGYNPVTTTSSYARSVDAGSSADETTIYTQRLGLQWWLSGAAIDLGFADGKYYDGALGADVTTYLSCSRASIGYAKNADGTLTSFGNDTLRIGVGTGLLVEDARTNDILYSQDYTHAGGWSLVSLVTPTSGVAAPDGTSTAWKVVADTTAGSNHNFQQSVSIAAVNYTVSIFAKAAEYNFANLELAINSGTGGRYSINVNLTTGAIESSDTTGSPVVVSTGTELYGNGWVRIWIVVTATAGALYAQISPCPTATPTYSNSIPIYTGDNTSGVYFWGVQFEVGSFPSSLIPTTTAAATRAADVVNAIGNLSTVLTGSAMSVVFDGKLIPQPTATTPIMISCTSHDYVLYTVTSNAIVRTFDGAVELGTTIGNSLTLYDGAKLGLAGDGSGRSVVGGGGTVASDANDIPVLSGTVHLIHDDSGNIAFFAYCRRLTVWNSKLADATLQALTAP